MATHEYTESSNKTSKSDSASIEAQIVSMEEDISDALEISETYPIIAPSEDVYSLVKTTLDEAPSPSTSIEEIVPDEQTTIEIEATASETPQGQGEVVAAEQATLHADVSELADSMCSRLEVSAKSPSVQEPECSKQSEIQSPNTAAYTQTVEGHPSEEMKDSLMGRRISKNFDGLYYEGQVVGYDPVTEWFKISYTDGDEEEMDLVEVQQWVADDDHEYSTDQTSHPTDKAADEHITSPSTKAKKSGAPKNRKPPRATAMNPKNPQTPVGSAQKSREGMPTRSTSDLSNEENAQSVHQSAKTTPESSQKRKPSRATAINPKTDPTPVKSVKRSCDAIMPTRLNPTTPDLSIAENAQSVQQSTKTTPESSQKKRSSRPPTSPPELTTEHMETAGSATKKRYCPKVAI